jgi:hypothetical protein
MSRCSREISLEDALSDSIVKAVMAADGLEPQDLVDTMTSVARARARPRTGTHESSGHCWMV